MIATHPSHSTAPMSMWIASHNMPLSLDCTLEVLGGAAVQMFRDGWTTFDYSAPGAFLFIRPEGQVAIRFEPAGRQVYTLGVAVNGGAEGVTRIPASALKGGLRDVTAAIVRAAREAI